MADDLFKLLFPDSPQEVKPVTQDFDVNTFAGQDAESTAAPQAGQRDELTNLLFPIQEETVAQDPIQEQPVIQDQISDPEPIQEPVQFAQELGAPPQEPVQAEPVQDPVRVAEELEQPTLRQSPQTFNSRQEALRRAVPIEGEVEPTELVQGKTGLAEAMVRSVGSGTGELAISIARAPQTTAEIYIGLNNLFNKGLNKVVEGATFGKVKDVLPMADPKAIPGIIKLKEDAWDTKAVRKFVKNQREAVSLATNGKGIVDNLLAGDFGEAGKSLGIQAAAQIPLVASMFVGGIAGMSAKTLGNVAGATAASQQMDQYWQEVDQGIAKQNPDMASANALVNGFIEKFGETLGTGKIVTEAIDLLGKAGKKEIAKKTVGKAVGNYVGKVMQSAGTEFSEEAIVGFSQTVSDKIFGAKPDATFLDAVKEGVEGGLTGFATSFGTTGQLAAIAEAVPGKKAPDAQIEPSETVQEKPIETPAEVTEEVVETIEPTPEEKQLAERIRTEQAEQAKEKGIPEPTLPKDEKVVLEQKKPITEPAEIEPKKPIEKKEAEKVLEKKQLEKEKAVVKKEKVTVEEPVTEKKAEKLPEEKPDVKETKIVKVEGQEVDVAPTEAQKEAGNYKKAHINRDGLEISIENPAGSTRSGTDPSGKTWSQEMKLDYGYIKETKGRDKDHVDIMIKPGAKEGGNVFVVNQVDPKTKKLDEHKAVVGFETEQQALEAYNSNYEKGWKGAGSIVEMSMDEFKTWVKSNAPSKGEAKAVDVTDKIDGITHKVFKETVDATIENPSRENITNLVSNILHPDNKASRKLFEKEQGVKLPDTGKMKDVDDTRKVLQDWAKSKKETVVAEQPKVVPTTSIKINTGTKEIEIERGTKVTYGKKEGEVVGFRNIKGKYYSRFKDSKTGKIELVPLSKTLKPVGVKPSEGLPGKKKLTIIEKQRIATKRWNELSKKKMLSRKKPEVTKEKKGKEIVSGKGESLTELFHGTTKEGFSAINKENRMESPVFLTPRKSIAEDYAGVEGSVVSVDIPKSKLMIDLDLPGSRLLTVESANVHLEKDYTIDDYINEGFSVAVEQDVFLKTPEKKVDGLTETEIKDIGDKPNDIEDVKPKKEPKKPRIQPSEAIPESPSEGKGKTNEQLRITDVLATARNTKAKKPADKNKQVKAVSDIAKQIQHNPGGEKKGSGWLNPLEAAYFKGKEIAWPILKMRKTLTEAGVKKETLLEDFDFAIDEVRGAADASQQYIADNYNPIFEPLNKTSAKEGGHVARDLSRYLVAKRTQWLYKNKKGYEDAGISLKTAETVVDYVENGDNPNSDMIIDMASQIWAYNKGLINVKHKAGVIDDQLLQNLKEPYYVPHYRDVDTGIHKPSNPRKLMFTATSTGIKRIKGSKSGHMIIDPLQLMISTTHETIVNAARAKVAQNIVRVAEEHPEIFDGLISKLPAKWLKAGSIEHRIQIDKLLREQIDSFTKKLDINVKTAAKLGKRRLGLFDSFNQTIKVLYGATESVRSHELGHAIDEKFPWLSKLLKEKRYKTEMNAVADSRYEGQEVPSKFVRYVRQNDEKTAEFIAMYLTNRPMLMKLAPNIFAMVDNKIKKDPVLKELVEIKPSNVKKMDYFYEDNYILDNSIPIDEDVISLRQEGKLVHYRVPVEMAQAVKNLHPTQLPSWIKWTLALQARMLRFGAVGGNIGFALPNIVKDQIDAAHNAKIIPFADWFIGARHVIENSEVAKMMIRRGGGMGSPESGISGAKRGYSDVIYGKYGKQFLDPFYWKNRGVLKGTGDLSLYAIKFPFKPILGLIELSEAASRVGIFRRDLLSSGVDLNNLKAEDAEFAIKQAVHTTRHSTIDFNRFGYSGKIPNAIVPFINAALEGVDRPTRAWVNPIQEGRLPIRPIMFTALTIGTYFGLTGWNDRFEEYKEVSSREKANNWIIMHPGGGGGYWKIPKGHITRLVLNPLQMIYEAMNGLASKKGWGLAVDIFTDISPIDPASFLPTTMKLIIEPIANYDFYWSDVIEKQALKANTPGFRFKGSTSETLKTIGEALNNSPYTMINEIMSPLMMQHEIRVAFGGLGRDMLWLTDWILGTAGVQKPPGLELENAIIIKRFVGKTEEWMSDSAERVRTINKRIAVIKRPGKKARVRTLHRMGFTPEEIKKTIKASNKELVQLYSRRTKLLKAQREIRKLKAAAERKRK